VDQDVVAIVRTLNCVSPQRRKRGDKTRIFIVTGAACILAHQLSATPTRAETPDPSRSLSAPAAKTTPKSSETKVVAKKKEAKPVAKNIEDNKRPVLPINETNNRSTVDNLRALDKVLGYKGWAFPFPSFTDTLLLDDGGFRTALASQGIGFLSFGIMVSQANMLDTPRSVPTSYPPCTYRNHLGGICAGNQAYFGESFGLGYNQNTYLTYDLGRVGLQGGQLQARIVSQTGTNEAIFVQDAGVIGVSWYQPLFDNRVEFKVGWLAPQGDLIGGAVGGNYALPFGSAASIPVELGMAISPAFASALRVKLNITDTVYNQSYVQRSLPLRGVTGNPIYDEVSSSKNIFLPNFGSDVAGTGVFLLDELGYRQHEKSGVRSTWIRGGPIFNTSEFTDFSPSGRAGTKSNVPGVYLLADQQLWQQAPSSDASSYRGIYAGFTYMYTPPETAAFYQNYEGRVYWIGPFDSRPRDMLTFSYAHNDVSKYITSLTNLNSALTNVFANKHTNTYGLTYFSRLMPGVYGTVGIAYTDHPSISYFPTEGSSLNFLGSLVFNL
jgi:porin